MIKISKVRYVIDDATPIYIGSCFINSWYDQKYINICKDIRLNNINYFNFSILKTFYYTRLKNKELIRYYFAKINRG